MMLDCCLLHAVQLEIFHCSMETRNITPKQGLNDLMTHTECYHSRHVIKCVKAIFTLFNHSTENKEQMFVLFHFLFVVISGVALGRIGGTEENTVRSTCLSPWLSV